ncbi:MAG: hypothetical protein ACJAZ3_001991 [Sphingobacteriales bacterium]|jgi:hypothetical protein
MKYLLPLIILSTSLSTYSQSFLKTISAEADVQGQNIAISKEFNQTSMIGFYKSEAKTNGQILTFLNDQDGFLVANTLNGELKFALSFSSNDYLRMEDVLIDNNGNTVVIGLYTGDTLRVADKFYPSNDSISTFILKFNSIGQIIQEKIIRSNDWVQLRSIKEASNGDFYIGGVFFDEFRYDDSLFKNVRPIPPTDIDADMIILQVDNDFKLIRGKNIGSEKYDQINKLVIDNLNNIYVGGRTEGFSIIDTTIITDSENSIFMKFDSVLNFQWFKVGLSNNFNEVHSMIIDNENNLIVGGDYFGQIIIDSDTINSSGSDKRCYITKINSADSLIYLSGLDFNTSASIGIKFIAIAPLNAVVFGGNYGNTFFILDSSATKTNFPRGYSVLMNENGEFLDFYTLDGSKSSGIHDLAIIDSSMFYTGYFSDTTYFGEQGLIKTENNQVVNDDGYMWKTTYYHKRRTKPTSVRYVASKVVKHYVYPNPIRTTGKLKIIPQLEGFYTLTIVNALGQVFYNNEHFGITAEIQIPQRIGNGVYWLVIKGKESSLSMPFVVED